MLCQLFALHNQFLASLHCAAMSMESQSTRLKFCNKGNHAEVLLVKAQILLIGMLLCKYGVRSVM